MTHRVSFFALAALASFALASCIDYDEQVVFDKDFGGRLTGTIGLSGMLAAAAAANEEGERDFSEEELRKELEGIEGLEVESVEKFKEAGKTMLRYTIAFDSIESLSQVPAGTGADDDEEGVRDFFGEITLTKESRKWVFERVVSLKEPSGDEDSGEGEANALAEGMIESLLGNNFFTFEVRFPSKVLSANVREFDEETNTVTWKFSVAQLAREPAVMRAEIFPPPRRLGTFLWLLLAIAGIAVVGSGALYLAFRRRSLSVQSPG